MMMMMMIGVAYSVVRLTAHPHCSLQSVPEQSASALST